MKKLIALSFAATMLVGCVINPPLSPEEQASLDANAGLQHAAIPTPPGEPLLAKKQTKSANIQLAKNPEPKPLQVALQTKPQIAPFFAKVAPPKPVVKHRQENAKLRAQARRLTQDEKALLAENANNYTIQFIADSDAGTIAKFINKNPAMSKNNQARTYYGHSEGKAWYKLVYGNYSSIKAARLAAASATKGLTHWKPYVRSIASVQKEIRG